MEEFDDKLREAAVGHDPQHIIAACLGLIIEVTYCQGMPKEELINFLKEAISCHPIYDEVIH